MNTRSLLHMTLLPALALSACAVDTDTAAGDGADVAATAEELRFGHPGPSEFTPFAFASKVSTSGAFTDGDVRLDAVSFGERTLRRHRLEPVAHARILIDDGLDVERGGHNFASGQGIHSADDGWEREGPATVTPTGRDLRDSLANFNLTSIVVTREAVGTASLEVTFSRPVDTFFFWERGNVNSPTTANSDLLVEALDARGRVTAAYKLLRSEYSPTGIAITTWNGSFYSPSTPDGVPPQLGSVGLALDGLTRTLRLTSVQEPEGGVRDDGPDYKVIAAHLGPLQP